MRVAIVNVKTGMVENVAEMGGQLPPNCIQPTQPPEGFLWIESDSASPGWSYQAGKLVAPIEEAITPARAPISDGDLAKLLIAKGLISQADIDAALSQ